MPERCPDGDNYKEWAHDKVCEKLRQMKARLRLADNLLRKYAGHFPVCRFLHGGACHCGYNEAMAEYKEKTKTTKALLEYQE